MQELQQILDNPGASLAIIGNLIIIESLLSVDNAAVLATMVMDLPNHQRDKALKYGLFGFKAVRHAEFLHVKPMQYLDSRLRDAGIAERLAYKHY